MSYKPEFTGPIEGYVVNFLRTNLWRVRETHTHEDAMSEAYVTFLVCASRYSHVDTPQHFMALFKRTWANHFHDLSTTSSTARIATPISQLERDDDEAAAPDIAGVVGELDNDGALAVLIRQAPHEVLMVLNLLLSAPQELLELAQTAWRRQGKYRADGERLTERMLGLPPGTNPLAMTERHFTRD